MYHPMDNMANIRVLNTQTDEEEVDQYKYQYSVFKEGNLLGSNENWRHPSVKVDNEIKDIYINALGDSARVNVNLVLGSYQPEPLNINMLHRDGDQLYVYPHQLKNLRDFISNWDESYAQSLVKYHPEYCYYEQCVEYSTEYAGYTESSLAFDDRLQNTMEFSEAIENGFAEITPSILIIETDPYMQDNSPYSTLINRQTLENKYRNYQAFGTEMLSIPEVAMSAIMCGTQYGENDCIAEYGSMTPDDKNNVWNMIKTMYLAEKRKLINATTRSSCSVTVPSGFERRYYIDNNYPPGMVSSVEGVEQGIWQQTGLCPLAFDYMNFLDNMASSGHLLDNTRSLMHHPAFTQRLYEAVREVDASTTPFAEVIWSSTTTGNNMTVSLQCGAQTKTIHLTKPSGIEWSEIEGFNSLEHNGVGNGNYNFIIKGRVCRDEGGTTTCISHLMQGYIDMNIQDCEFSQMSNAMSLEMEGLWRAMIENNQFFSSNNVDLSNLPYSLYTSRIRNKLSGATDLVWKQESGIEFSVKSVATPGKKIVYRVNTYTPSSYNQNAITGMGNIQLNSQNGYEVDLLDIYSSVVTHMSGVVVYVEESSQSEESISLGEEGISRPFANCVGDSYQMQADLEHIFVGLELEESEKINVLWTKREEIGAKASPLVQQIFDYTNENSECKINLYKKVIGNFDEIHIVGPELYPYGTVNYDGSYSSFFMLADFQLGTNVIHDTIFGGSSCMHINICSCPEQTILDVNQSYVESGAFDNCMSYAMLIIKPSNPRNQAMIDITIDCMSDLGIDNAGAIRMFGVAGRPDVRNLYRAILFRAERTVVGIRINR